MKSSSTKSEPAPVIKLFWLDPFKSKKKSLHLSSSQPIFSLLRLPHLNSSSSLLCSSSSLSLLLPLSLLFFPNLNFFVLYSHQSSPVIIPFCLFSFSLFHPLATSKSNIQLSSRCKNWTSSWSVVIICSSPPATALLTAQNQDFTDRLRIIDAPAAVSRVLNTLKYSTTHLWAAKHWRTNRHYKLPPKWTRMTTHIYIYMYIFVCNDNTDASINPSTPQLIFNNRCSVTSQCTFDVFYESREYFLRFANSYRLRVHEYVFDIRTNTSSILDVTSFCCVRTDFDT